MNPGQSAHSPQHDTDQRAVDADTLAALGWQHLDEGRPEHALAYFAQAIRKCPEHDSSCDGIVEALERIPGPYGRMLRFWSWASQLRGWLYQVMAIGGAIVFAGLKGRLGQDAIPRSAFWAGAVLLGVVYYLNLLGGAFHVFVLRASALGRASLRRDQLTVTNWIAALLALGFLGGIAGLLTREGAWGLATLFAPNVAVLAAFLLRLPPGWPSTIVKACVGIVALISVFLWFNALARAYLGDPAFLGTIQGTMAIAWVVAYLATLVAAVLLDRYLP